jgi:hypothetical protein
MRGGCLDGSVAKVGMDSGGQDVTVPSRRQAG